MNLIYYRGLNCHLACVVNIAASLGINYKNAFATLWSETDFTDEPNYHIYVSKRVLPNLKALGAKPEALKCASDKEAEESFSLIPEGELFLIGIDTFHVPWSPVYQNFYGPHYIFARKEKPDSLFCFDPIYNANNTQILSGDMIPHAFDLSRIHKLAADPPRFNVSREAREILRGHPETGETLSNEIQACKEKERKNIAPLIKQINAMISNRYLFGHFLHQSPSAFSHDQRFFNKDFFSRWEAVKNGLYKASIIKNNESLVDEVYGLFLNLIRKETDMAMEMIMLESDSGSD